MPGYRVLHQNLTLMKLLITLLIFLGGHLTANGSGLAHAIQAPDCDTLITSDGKIYLCHIQQHNREETLFSLCDDPEGKVFAISNYRISRIAHARVDLQDEVVAKQAAPIVKSKVKAPKQGGQKPPKEKHKKSEEELASTLLWRGILSLVLICSILLIPVGFFVGLFTVNDGKKLLQAIKGNPKFKKIRRKVRWAIILGSISMFLSIGFIIWLLKLLSNLPDIGNFSFGSWDWE